MSVEVMQHERIYEIELFPTQPHSTPQCPSNCRLGDLLPSPSLLIMYSNQSIGTMHTFHDVQCFDRSFPKESWNLPFASFLNIRSIETCWTLLLLHLSCFFLYYFCFEHFDCDQTSFRYPSSFCLSIKLSHYFPLFLAVAQDATSTARPSLYCLFIIDFGCFFSISKWMINLNSRIPKQ